MNPEVANYREYLRKKHHSKSTVASYLRDLRAFSEFIATLDGQGKSWREVSLGDARAHCQKLLDDDKSNSTVNRAITSLRLFYDFLLIRGEVAGNPFRELSHFKRNPPAPDVLSDDEAAWLVGAPMREYEVLTNTLSGEKQRRRGKYIFVRDQLVLEVLYYSGLKIYELAELRDQSVDAEMLTLKTVGKQGRNKTRSVLIPECVADTHHEYVRLRNLRWPQIALQRNPILLRDNRGRPVSRLMVWRTTAAYAQKSGLRPGLSPQVLRNTFALKLVARGAKAESLQYLLGLEDLSTAKADLDRYRRMLSESSKHTNPERAEVPKAAPGPRRTREPSGA